MNDEQPTLSSRELQQIHRDVWQRLKTDPEAAKTFLIEAGWVTENELTEKTSASRRSV